MLYPLYGFFAGSKSLTAMLGIGQRNNRFPANAAGEHVLDAITRAGGVAPFAAFPADAVLRIAVTVVGGGETVTLVGYRTRYAPNAAG